MALITADRVYETSTTTGTGTYALAGAKDSTYQAFSAVCANNDTVYYCAFDTANGGWETGIGTWATGGTLARTTIHKSSNANAAVSWAAGTRQIILTETAASLSAGAAAEVLISEQTPSGTGVVTFSSLGSYRSLRITGMGRGTQSATSVVVKATFNGDTGNNYQYQLLVAHGTTLTGSSATANAYIYLADLGAATAPANSPSSFEFYLPDYGGTTFHKTMLGNYSARLGTGTADGYVIDVSGWWLNTAAITSITLTLSAGNYASGTRISLYGVN